MQYKTVTISIHYELKLMFKLSNNIMFTDDLKRVFNYQKGTEITTSNNMKKGFWCNRKFYRLDKIKDLVEPIPKYEFITNDYLTNL